MNLLDKLKRRKYLTALSVGTVIMYLLLLIPEPGFSPPKNATKKPFVWNQDERWFALEERFKEVRALGCEHITTSIDKDFHKGHKLLDAVDSETLNPDAKIFDNIEQTIFGLGPSIGA